MGYDNPEIEMYPLISLMTFQHTYMLVHSGLLCYLRECFSILNSRLAQRSIDPFMTRIYHQLRGMYEELNRIHGISMLGIIACLLLSNSMVGYISFVMFMLPDVDKASYRFLFGSKFYVFLLIHWYNYFMLCHSVETTIKEFDLILYEYSTNEDKEIEKELELLVFSRCLHEPSVKFCGIIEINRSSLFCILATTVSYIITLIQLDYVNLK
ncbi:putative gustatory receptor 22a [Musca autumnalis]|uniref:putative gustatory receptor 22a n=1 Tax=Musca autumnalis TaxID=221902 RepID=UPI003CF0B8E0